MTDRLEYFDFLRGIAIIGVVAIHTYIASADVTAIDVGLFLRQIINCSVPIFLAVSGFFLANKETSTLSDYFRFERRQIMRVYIPMIVWSLPYFFTGLTCENADKHLALMLTGVYGVCYFIPLIIQFYILLPLLKKIANPRGLFFSLLVTLCSMGLLFYLFNIMHMKLPLFVYAAPFPVWLVFFVTGLYFGSNSVRHTPKVPLYIGLALLFVVVSYYESLYVSSMHEHPMWFGIKASSTLYALAIIFLMFSVAPKYKSNRFTRSTALVGTLSFGIYLIHLHVYAEIGKATYFCSLSWLARTVVVVVISSAICYLMRRLLPRFSKQYLGF